MNKNNSNTDYPLISIIIPCFNEEEVLPLCYEKLTEVLSSLKEYRYEILFIDDGSKDNTIRIIKDFAKSDSHIQYFSFSKNFGKEAALYAGLENARGDYVALMDADLQDPPELLPEMLHAVTIEGYDSAATYRQDRKGEPPIRSFFARTFYRLMSKITKTNMKNGARDYRLMNRKMVDAIISMGEYNRFSKGIFGWIGFETKWIPYENVKRAAGQTKWSFSKLFVYSIDGIVGFSTMPLSLASAFGILLFLLSIIMIIIIIVRTVVFGDPVEGWPSTICIMLLLSGLQMFFIGILGQYLSKTYLETKKRPIYILRDSHISDEDEL